MIEKPCRAKRRNQKYKRTQNFSVSFREREREREEGFGYGGFAEICCFFSKTRLIGTGLGRPVFIRRIEANRRRRRVGESGGKIDYTGGGTGADQYDDREEPIQRRPWVPNRESVSGDRAAVAEGLCLWILQRLWEAGEEEPPDENR